MDLFKRILFGSHFILFLSVFALSKLEIILFKLFRERTYAACLPLRAFYFFILELRGTFLRLSYLLYW